jgi:hypothetical protein
MPRQRCRSPRVFLHLGLQRRYVVQLWNTGVARHMLSFVAFDPTLDVQLSPVPPTLLEPPCVPAARVTVELFRSAQQLRRGLAPVHVCSM